METYYFYFKYYFTVSDPYTLSWGVERNKFLNPLNIEYVGSIELNQIIFSINVKKIDAAKSRIYVKTNRFHPIYKPFHPPYPWG